MAGRGSGGVQAGEEGFGRRLVVPAGRGATGGGSRTSGEFLLKMNSGEAGAAARGEERYGSWGKWIEEGVGFLIGGSGGAGMEGRGRSGRNLFPLSPWPWMEGSVRRESVRKDKIPVGPDLERL